MRGCVMCIACDGIPEWPLRLHTCACGNTTSRICDLRAARRFHSAFSEHGTLRMLRDPVSCLYVVVLCAILACTASMQQ